ncbi:TonB-linked SusC/RagA family outer membrane protein [Chitinophaga niastensis]|uniref:TonB-linked SusC/RagA family outer membrane protein n=1 Tax=Chitinophaga niastensis TaxID=536980 RepID=A0A2P8HNL7_CHINA|nr:SusC/RagA family TonB-linked outer membrane protein [Chitinophaga niastensis]PSL47804.1 TonB-linked SusC/RagA family outer membrane protein [Chitinophaga niastensis]
MHKFANSNRTVIFFMRVALLQICLLFCLLTCSFAKDAHAQEVLSKKVSLNLPPSDLRNILKTITEKTAVNFTYSNSTLPAKQRIALTAHDEQLGDVLHRLLSPLHIAFEVINEQIVLKKDKSNDASMNIEGMNVLFQKVNGIVKSTDGSVLPGVNVMVAGTTRGTVTDINGHFELDAKEGDVLIFSSIGFTQQRVTVGVNSALNIVMATSATSLDAVAVTALGIKRSVRTLGYSQEEVKGGEVARSNAPNIINALGGKMAGVNITNPNGVDGGSTRIVIGGNNAIQGDNQPLIIVDGMPMANDLATPYDVRNSPTGSAMYGGSSKGDAANTSAPKDFGNPINMINPEDIETISVLKGPTAAALYGGKGANGVILITTKKGSRRAGLGVDYTYGYKIIQPTRFLQLQNEYGAGGMVSLDAPQYLVGADGKPKLTDGGDGMFQDPKTGSGPYGIALNNQVGWPGSGLSWGHKMDGTLLNWWDGTQKADLPQPNNIKLLYRNGIQSSHNVSLSGGNEWGSIRASFSRLDNSAVLPNSDYYRNTFNLGANMKLTKRVNVQITSSYIVNQYHNPPQLGNDDNNSWQKNLIYNDSRNYQGEDIGVYKNPDGSKNTLTGFPWVGNSVVWNMMENNTIQNRRKLLSGVQLNYEATDFLDFIFRGGLDNNTNELTTKNTPTDVLGLKGYYGHGTERDNASNLDFLGTLHKDKMFNNTISAKFSVGGTIYQRDMYGMFNYNDNWAIPYVYSLNDGTFLDNPHPVVESQLRKKMNSVYSFLNLSYKDFLYLDVTGRNDWSSALPKGQWSYFFPSFAGSFVFSDLLHIDPAVLSFGKIRAAWAQAAVDPAPYQVNYNYTASTFAGQAAIQMPNSLPAFAFKPAINTTADFGVVLGFLNNRINLDARYYKGKSRNQILRSPLPLSSGVDNVVVNTGVLENSGIELILRAKVIDQSSFKWDVALNLAHSNNRLLSLSDGTDHVNMGSAWGDDGSHGPVVSARVGDQFGTIYGYDYVYDPKTRLPLMVQDPFGKPEMNGTLYKATDGLVPLGNATPKVTGGITNTFMFKGGISVSTLVDCKIGGDIWSGTYATIMQQGQARETLKERDGGGLPYTTPDGTKTNWGVVLPGVFPDGKVNDNVVHYYYKYMPYGVWSSTDLGGGVKGSDWINKSAVLENTWVKMREISINYQLPASVIRKTKVFQSASVSLVGRDLFYFYTSLPDHINPEGVNGAGNAQGLEFMSLPSFRSLGFQVRVSF